MQIETSTDGSQLAIYDSSTPHQQETENTDQCFEENDVITMYVTKQLLSFWKSFDEKLIVRRGLDFDNYDFVFGVSCSKCTCYSGSEVLTSGFHLQVSLK